MISASCRRLLHRNGVYYSHHQMERAPTVAKFLQMLSRWPAKRLFCASASLNKFNQPKLKEENELSSSDLTHPQPRPPGVLPPNHTHAKEDSKLGSHSHAVTANASAVDGALCEQHQYEEGQVWTEERSKVVVGESGREQREEGEEEWSHTELSWRKLPSIYFKLSKSRLTGTNRTPNTCTCTPFPKVGCSKINFDLYSNCTLVTYSYTLFRSTDYIQLC